MASAIISNRELSKYSIEELKDLQDRTFEIIKLKREQSAYEMKDKLRIGQKVIIDLPKYEGQTFKLHSIRIKKAVIQQMKQGEVFGPRYTISMGLLKIIK